MLSQYWWPENGVPQRRWTWLSRILHEQGYNVTVLAPPPHYQRTIPFHVWLKNRRDRHLHKGQTPTSKGASGERVVRTGFFPAGPSLSQRVLNQASVALAAIWAVVRKPGRLSSYRPEIVIGTVPALPTAFATYIASRVYGVPYIIDLRDAWPDLLVESDTWNKSTGKASLREKILRRGPLQLVTIITRKTINFVLRNSSAIIVTSDQLGQDLAAREELRKNGSTPPTYTIRNVFPPETVFTKRYFQDEDSDARLHVLYAGTIGRAQNLMNALIAASIAHENGIDISLRLVGSGAAKKQLQITAKKLPIEILFETRHDADGLKPYYDWADTALVHLTDWEALDKAVPSKTYELMNMGIHITGVVKGEAADLINKYDAGCVVEPEDPQALADAWIKIAQNRSLLRVAKAGKNWIDEERNNEVPRTIAEILKRYTGDENNA